MANFIGKSYIHDSVIDGTTFIIYHGHQGSPAQHANGDVSARLEVRGDIASETYVQLGGQRGLAMCNRGRLRTTLP